MNYRVIRASVLTALSALVALCSAPAAISQHEDILAKITSYVHCGVNKGAAASEEHCTLPWLRALLALHQRPKFPDNGTPGWVIDAYTPNEKSLILSHESDGFAWETQKGHTAYLQFPALRMVYLAPMKHATCALSAKVGLTVPIYYKKSFPFVELNACVKYPLEIWGNRVHFYSEARVESSYDTIRSKFNYYKRGHGALRFSCGGSTLAFAAMIDKDHTIQGGVGMQYKLPFAPRITVEGDVGMTKTNHRTPWRVVAHILATSRLRISVGYQAEHSNKHGPFVDVTMN